MLKARNYMDIIENYKLDVEELHRYKNMDLQLKGHTPWKNAPEIMDCGDKHHYKLSEHDKKSISVCLNCDRKKCSGSCIKVIRRK